MSLASLEWGRGAAGGRKRGFKGFVVDMPLLLILFAIVGLGLVVLYSAVSAESGLVVRQGMRFAVGLAASPGAAPMKKSQPIRSADAPIA